MPIELAKIMECWHCVHGLLEYLRIAKDTPPNAVHLLPLAAAALLQELEREHGELDGRRHEEKP